MLSNLERRDRQTTGTMCPALVEVNTLSSEHFARGTLRRHVATIDRPFVSISLLNYQAT